VLELHFLGMEGVFNNKLAASDGTHQRASDHPSASRLRASAPAVAPCRPGHRPHLEPLSTRIPCATPDLFLKHSDATVATYKRRHMKHLKYASENTYKKYLKNTWKPSQTYTTFRWKNLQQMRETLEHLKNTLAICMYMQHLDLLLQHTSAINETFETYTRNIRA